MGYWRDLYASKIRSNDFIEGVIAAMEAYAVMHDGERSIGVGRQPLKEAIAEVKKDLEYDEEQK